MKIYGGNFRKRENIFKKRRNVPRDFQKISYEIIR